MLRFEESNTKRRMNRSRMMAMRSGLLCILLCTRLSFGFIPSPISTSVSTSNQVFPATGHTTKRTNNNREVTEQYSRNSKSSSSALNVWWFGGTEQSEPNGNEDSCELVAVRIERTSANSRRIAGEITVPATIDEVWSILTDYDRLATHVPNLMESRIVQRLNQGRNGDGSFRCRLYQKGAQKIIGFDFSASVTMDMTEKILTAANMVSKSGSPLPQSRRINFKCVDSQFFTTFDGDWIVTEKFAPDGSVETVCSYSVDVRPKGPVPVAALEWRIREDVPTNLRAVKAATLALAQPRKINTPALARAYADKNSPASRQSPRLVSSMMDWDRDETMAKYL